MSEREDSAGVVQEPLVVTQDIAVPDFIRRTFSRKVAGNMLGIHRALTELAAKAANGSGRWSRQEIADCACMSVGVICSGISLMKRYGLVEEFSHRTVSGQSQKPTIVVRNLSRVVAPPDFKSGIRPTPPDFKSGIRVEDKTTRGGVSSGEVPQGDYNVGSSKTLRSSLPSGEGQQAAPHASASPQPGKSKATANPGSERAWAPSQDARAGFLAEWEAVHPGRRYPWGRKEAHEHSAWERAEDFGMRRLAARIYVRERGGWPEQNGHPLSGLTRNGPKYVKQAQEFLDRLDGRGRAAAAAVKAASEKAQPEPEHRWTRSAWDLYSKQRKNLKLDPLPEPLDFEPEG